MAPKSHDLVFLLNQIKNEVTFEEDMLKHARLLTDFGVVFRYPDEMDNDENKTNLAIKYSEEIFNWSNSVVESKN